MSHLLPSSAMISFGKDFPLFICPLWLTATIRQTMSRLSFSGYSFLAWGLQILGRADVDNIPLYITLIAMSPPPSPMLSRSFVRHLYPLIKERKRRDEIGFIVSPPAIRPKCWISILDVDSLLYIFQLAIGDDRLPMALSHICRQWRDIVLHTPTLWTSIKVWQTLHCDILHFSQTLLRVQHALKMSGGCAVAVEIYIKTPWSPLHEPRNEYLSEDKPVQVETLSSYTQRLSTILVAHSSHIEKLCIIANEPSISDIQKSLAGLPMPLLAHCCITPQGPNPPNSQDSDTQGPDFLVCSKGGAEDVGVDNLYPKLNSLQIHSAPLVCAQLFPRNLHTLSLSRLRDKGRLSASDLRQVLLANEHSLRDLRLPGGAPLDSAIPYVMPNVRSLSLAYETPNELVPFLLSVKVPNLENFSLKDLARSRRSIRSLYQDVYDPSIESLVAALVDNLPLHNLISLRLGWVRFLPYRRHLNKHAHQWVPNIHNLPIPTFLFRFMSLMTSLERLSMSDPDYPSLFSLNYYPHPASVVGTDPISSTPVPLLSSLTLEVFNLRLVQKFIARRLVTVLNSRPPLAELCLKMPRNWRSKLRFNMSLIAESIVMADLEFHDRGEESILMEPYE